LAIFYNVRVVPETMPPLVDAGRLEILAAIQHVEHRKLAAEAVAQSCADKYGYCFDVYQVTERQHGRYRPKGALNGKCALEGS
jgi:hypothetical protein